MEQVVKNITPFKRFDGQIYGGFTSKNWPLKFKRKGGVVAIHIKAEQVETPRESDQLVIQTVMHTTTFRNGDVVRRQYSFEGWGSKFDDFRGPTEVKTTINDHTVYDHKNGLLLNLSRANTPNGEPIVVKLKRQKLKNGTNSEPKVIEWGKIKLRIASTSNSKHQVRSQRGDSNHRCKSRYRI